MMPPCLLVNPRSFRASRSGLALRAVRLAQAAGLDVHHVVDPTSLRARLDVLRERRAEQIWILAGDGTIHALAEYFAETHPEWSPALLLLAGGRANVVPRDIGGYPAMPALRRALAALRAGQPLREEHIQTLRISQPGRPPRHGFLFAGALVHEAVRLTANNRAAGGGWWRHSWFSDPFILLRWAIRTLVFRSPLPPLPYVEARLAGSGELAGPMRALIASTLEMRNALYNPFAARGTGPVRFTAIAAAAPSMLGMLPALLKGRFKPHMDPAHGVLSGRGERVELQGINGFALDGELFTADPVLPLVLTAGVALRALRPVP
jgi:Diacylglycerol kinase catalytic domain